MTPTLLVEFSPVTPAFVPMAPAESPERDEPLTPDRSPFAERAARGAAMLDRRVPGWHRRIALDRLAMDSCDRCILGQVFSHFSDGLRILYREEPDRANRSFAPDYGFMALSNDGYAKLAACWRAEVTARLARDAEVGP